MKLSKKMAVVLSGALVAGGVAAVVAPSAQALPSTALALGCDVVGLSSGIANWNASHEVLVDGKDGVTVGQTPIQVGAGSTVPYSYTFTAGPNNGGPASNGRVRAEIRVIGDGADNTFGTGDDSSATITTAWFVYGAPVANNAPFPGATLAGSFTAPSADNYSFRIQNSLFQGFIGVPAVDPNVPAANVNCNAQLTHLGQAGTNPSNTPIAYGATAFQSLGATASVTSVDNQVAGVTTYARAGNTIVISGADWFPSSSAISATVNGTAAASDTLATDSSGNLTGGIVVASGTTTGAGSIVITQGALSNTISGFNVLGTPSITITPASSSPAASYAVGITGSNFDPLKGTTYLACGSNTTTAPIFCSGVDGVPVPGVSSNHGSLAPIPASATGTVAGSVTIDGTTGFFGLETKGRLLIQVAQGSGPTAVTASLPFDIFADRCVAWNDNVTAGSCQTVQNVAISVLQGRLTQRAYTTALPVATGTGVIDSTATTPVQGTRNFNTSATEVNLGSLITPLVPTDVFGTLNDVTVSDNRGGTNGWSLVADITDPDSGGPKLDEFNGLNGNEIAANALFATANCVETNGTGDNRAWDYNNVNKVELAGYDYSLNAPVGTGAPVAEQQFPVGAGAVTLCTKSANVVDAVTQSTGGVYTVGADLRLRVPAFQAADKYSAVVTITLS